MSGTSTAVATASALSGPSTTTATQRVRLIHPALLAKHNGPSSLWVSYKGRVYDITDFTPDHPGGDDLIHPYAGKDLGDIMEDPIEHSHSNSAFELLEEHCIGRLPQSQEEEALCAPEKTGGAEYTGKDNEVIITDDFVPADTDLSGDYKQHKFLDLNKPLIMQVWNAKFGKDFYLEQVHSPRHLREPARLFGPWYLEMFTRTPWYVVPLVWAPISIMLFLRSAYQFSQAGQLPSGTFGQVPAAAASAFVNASSAMQGQASPLASLAPQADNLKSGLAAIDASSVAMTAPFWMIGLVIWTILEYTLHRFLFHVDALLPDRPFFLMLHFLLHGIHHYLPMDRLRLVMPPLLFAVLSFPFTRLAYALFPVAVANGIISGAFTMYIGYDSMHYALHHTKLPAYIKDMKKYHLEHHYKNYESGFGVTSKFWDWVFGTEL